MAKSAARNKLLSMIENGNITAEEGLRLLDALGEDQFNDNVFEGEEVGGSEFSEVYIDEGEPTYQSVSDSDEGTSEVDIHHLPSSSPDIKRIARLKKWWFLPFSIGLILTIISYNLDVPWLYIKRSWMGFLAILDTIYFRCAHYGVICFEQ